MKKTDLCPCGSNQYYSDCCQRFWATQQTAQTAEQLMRSRYTAFVLEKAQYFQSILIILIIVNSMR